MWSLTTQLSLVAIVVAVATVVALLLRARTSLYVRFALFAGSIATYYVTTLIWSILEGTRGITAAPPLLASARILCAAAILGSSTVFFDAILGDAGVSARSRRRKTTLVAALMAACSLVPLLRVAPWASFWTQAAAAVTVIIMLGARAIAVLQRSSEVESRADRVRLRYLANGGLAALVGFILDLASVQGVPVPPLGGLVIAVYLYFISQALLVARLLDLHELLGKALVFATLAFILAVVYGVLVVWVGERRGLFLFNTLIASSLVLILFEPLKTYLEETTTRVFFREHVTFARAMRKTARRIASVIEPPRAIATVLDNIYEAKRATHTSVYLLDPGGLAFHLQDHRGARPASLVDGVERPALFSQAMRHPTPLLRDILARRLGDGGERDPALAGRRETAAPAQDEAMLRALDELKADLVVPLRATSGTLGLLCLRDERLSEAYASDEIAALMQVAEQLAITIENSRLYDVLKERDRLALLGEMSAGLAHEIRNPLAAIKGAAQELDPTPLDDENRELLDVIVSEVDRLNKVVAAFLGYARPFRGTFAPISVNDAVRRTVQLMAHDLHGDVAVQLDLAERIPDVSGDAEQLQQVLINLVLNAAEAMHRRGEIFISTAKSGEKLDPALFGIEGAHGFVEIRVRDTGPGIPRQIKESLFIPFFTTKEHGTGLGLALCQRIVQHHGGNIEVRSIEGQGATFIVRLPANPISSSPTKALPQDGDSDDGTSSGDRSAPAPSTMSGENNGAHEALGGAPEHGSALDPARGLL
jgi:two-component system sensor histidine kinase HydH